MIGLNGTLGTPRAEFRDEEISMELLPVEVAFNSLSEAISELSNITDALESRLSPLLFPVSDGKNKAASGNALVNESELSCHISREAERVFCFNSRISEILRRIDLPQKTR